MANTIKIKRSSVSGKVPTTSQLELGELAVNTHDGKLYTKKDDGTAAVVEIGGASASADSLTTARTIALSGDVSGSTSFDGSANVTITATVADDSHNHIISNVDGLQTALDAKLPLAGGQLTGNITFSGAQTVDGRDLSADGSKLDGIEAGATADQTAAEILTAIKTVDGAGSGLDADTLDGVQGSSYAQLASPALTGTPTAPTAVAGTNTTQVATTAFVSTAVANVVDAAPGALDTLNELAAALGDDANFSTTVTNSIATKLPLAGGQMTGNITFSSTQTVDGRDLSVDGAKLDGIEAGATADQTASEILTAIKTVDGSGSGLDADTVDGLNSSSFLRSDASDTATGAITFDGGSTASHGPIITSSSSGGPKLSIKATATGGKDWWLISNGSGNTDGAGYLQLWNHTDSFSPVTFGYSSGTPTEFRTGIEINNNTVLHAGNYTSYSPSLTGSGASGTWGINITGSAGSVTYTLGRGSYLIGSNYNGSASTTWAVDATSSNTASKVVARDANGDFSGRYITGTYFFSSYLSMSHSQSTRSSDTIFYSSTDQYLRKNNASGMRASLSVPHLEGNNTFTLAQRGQVDALSSASTITPNFNNSNNFSISLSTNTTIANPSNLTAGQSGAIAITYNGGYTVAFGSYWKFPGGTAPTATSTSGKTDVLVYYVESSTRISAQLLLNMGG